MKISIPDRDAMLRHALEYAACGWHVIPVGAGADRKLPYIKNWVQLASVDQEQICSWWVQFPTANIGVVTGEKSRFWVVDIDVKPGLNGWDSLTERFGNRFAFDRVNSLFAKTASGGIHLLFEWDDAFPVRNGQGVLPGVDIRGDGGQIVVAPSWRLVDGQVEKYRWNDVALTIVSAPDWARELVAIAGRKSKRLDLVPVMSGLPEGSRDTELWRYACHLAGRGVPIDLALSFIVEAATRCDPPFDTDVARAKVVRAYSESLSTEGLLESISALEKAVENRRGAQS